MTRALAFIILTLAISNNLAADILTDAKAVERMAPRYPLKELQSNREGWAVISYVIDKDGSVIDPKIDDSTGVSSFEKAALKVVKKWKYEPATLNGEPVQQCRTRAKITFAIRGNTATATPKFVRNFKKIVAFIDANELTEAETHLNDLRELSSWNLYEDAWYWYLKSHLDRKKGDYQSTYSSLKRAVAYEGNYLPDNEYLSSLETLFLLDVHYQHYAEALRTYEQIKALSDEIDPKTQKTAETIQAQLDSHLTLKMDIQLDTNGQWHFELPRRRFSIGSGIESLDSFEARCDAKRQIVSIEKKQVWSVPSSWGRCTLYLEGEAGKSVELLLVPNPSSTDSASL
ncbi:energy transducer TonB [Simiduia sp. 21SJ11W-1]|uniref:energy transducer TonB n=1 Tax=Simiduia sp. 21SJ11W-1 TaxID=2909669 RepID=UPI00209DFE40|nr:energy transducer TonB [Simiduia sp. 21SJ11W-1]UTA47611.1 energy transducer TonB [Simiduia sp. 21SJ11W-1]